MQRIRDCSKLHLKWNRIITLLPVRLRSSRKREQKIAGAKDCKSKKQWVISSKQILSDTVYKFGTQELTDYNNIHRTCTDSNWTKHIMEKG